MQCGLSGMESENALQKGRNMDSLTLAKTAAGILDAKKADHINVIRINNISSLGDYFVIANGTSNTHVHALADELEEKLKELGSAPARVEGYRSNSWIILDYEEVVVHLFTADAREFYDLDRLWADGEKLDLKDIIISEM